MDPDRIYVTGFSSGGKFTLTLATQLSDVIAGAVSFAGNFVGYSEAAEEYVSHPPLELPVKVLMVCGMDDDVFPPGMVRGQRADVQVRALIYLPSAACIVEVKKTVRSNCHF